jgi:hypothetical protein
MIFVASKVVVTVSALKTAFAQAHTQLFVACVLPSGSHAQSPVGTTCTTTYNAQCTVGSTGSGRRVVCLNQRCVDVTAVTNDPSLSECGTLQVTHIDTAICDGSPAISYSYPSGTCGSASVTLPQYRAVSAFVPSQGVVRTYCCQFWASPPSHIFPHRLHFNISKHSDVSVRHYQHWRVFIWPMC